MQLEPSDQHFISVWQDAKMMDHAKVGTPWKIHFPLRKHFLICIIIFHAL